VSQYYTDTDLANETTLFNTTAEMTFDQGAFFEASQNLDGFLTDDDGTMARAICTVDMIINDRNREELSQIFGYVYNVTYGVKLFSNDTTVAIIETGETHFEAYLSTPEYSNDYIVEVDEDIAEQFFAINTTATANTATDEPAFQGFNIKFDTEKEQSKADKLKVKFELDAPSSILLDSAHVVQWA